MSWSKRAYNQSESAHNFPRTRFVSASLGLGSVSITDSICGLIQRRYGEWRNASKRLAKNGNTTPRAARNWLDGTCAPRIDNLVELMAADPDFEAAVLSIVHGRRAEREGS